ncbi:DUF4347 domain-containing protein, partial [Geitlerinema sp. PCC 9228]|uniref:DUF4347 domain-containing protein n=1 Tax=Geitlerinema sp. PCC 9228 TaxID=111611 RepID=UPI0011148A28
MNQVTPIYQGKIASHPAIATNCDRTQASKNASTYGNYQNCSQESPKKVIFLDERIPDLEILATNAIAGSEIAIVNRHCDGIHQISQHLRNFPYPVEVHLVCHGSPGSLDFGSNGLRLDNIDAYRHDLQAWNISTLVLYGCNVAAGDAGSELIEKLQQFTNAKIAASTTKVGSSALGGSWTLDVFTHEKNSKLAFSPDGLQAYRFVFPEPIDSISYDNEDLPDNSTPQFTDGKTYTFQVGDPNNRNITGFEINSNSYNFVQLLDKIKINRVDNTQVSGKQEILWYEAESSDDSNVSNVNLRPTFVDTMEDVLLGRTLNRGVDNLFTNENNKEGNQNNIERVDFISTTGISAPASNKLEEIGFALFERGGNDEIKIAAITGIDENGQANSFGDAITVDFNSSSSVFDPPEQQFIFRKEPESNFQEADTTNQDIAGAFISYSDLNISNNQTFYGYAIFGSDVTDVNGDITDNGAYPRNTEDDSGLDLVGSGSVFAVNGAAPPIVDLDSNDSSGATGTGYQTTWTEGDGGVAIGDNSDITIKDADSNQLQSATIELTSLPNGNLESLSVSGSLPGDITSSYDPNTGILELTGNASVADYQDAIAQIQYNNTSDNPDTSDRSVEVTVTDSDGNQSNIIATTTIQISPNDPPTAADETTITINEDSSHTFSESDFGFSDADGDSLQTITITNLPSNGSLQLDGSDVTADQEIAADQIGNLVFTPDADKNGDSYANFDFTVNDGTTDSEAKTITIDVTPQNDPPTTSNNTITINEDS